MDSSDFCTCEVCGSYEICLLSDGAGPSSGMYSCFDKGHNFCKNCFPEFHKQVTSVDNVRRIIKEFKWAMDFFQEVTGKKDPYKESDDIIAPVAGEILQDYYAEVPSQECPMCLEPSFKDDEIVEYLLKKHKTTREKVVKEMKKDDN